MSIFKSAYIYLVCCIKISIYLEKYDTLKSWTLYFLKENKFTQINANLSNKNKHDLIYKKTYFNKRWINLVYIDLDKATIIILIQAKTYCLDEFIFIDLKIKSKSIKYN